MGTNLNAGAGTMLGPGQHHTARIPPPTAASSTTSAGTTPACNSGSTTWPPPNTKAPARYTASTNDAALEPVAAAQMGRPISKTTKRTKAATPSFGDTGHRGATPA